MLYENENYVPIGFTYDYYITEESYETTVKNTRANLLMRALVLSEEDAETYGKYLEKLPDAKLDDLWYDTYVSDCADRRASACSSFQMTNSGFHAEITLKKDNLVFFSVPYDDGFTAYVNGKETEVIRVDGGLMAVLAPAGENTIDFVYQPTAIPWPVKSRWQRWRHSSYTPGILSGRKRNAVESRFVNAHSPIKCRALFVERANSPSGQNVIK